LEQEFNSDDADTPRLALSVALVRSIPNRLAPRHRSEIPGRRSLNMRFCSPGAPSLCHMQQCRTAPRQSEAATTFMRWGVVALQ
jgi:hypothetical protein